MSVKPPIKCPPDYSVLVLRLTECKKIGIVKGVTTQLALDLQDMFVPITNYEERQITLKAGETKKIDVSSVGEYGPLKESFEFVANNQFCGDGTNHVYKLYDENLVLIESVSFVVTAANPLISTFALAFALAIQSSTKIKTLINFDASKFTGVTGKITATATTAETKYRHLFEFDTSGFGGYSPAPYSHPGNLITPYRKYKTPRIKVMLIYPDFYKANVLNGCGCIDASGDMKSNKKWIEYAYDDDYNKITNPNTPIVVSPGFTLPSNVTGFLWQSTSTDHIGYHIKVNDLIATTADVAIPILRGFVTTIQGYDVSTDTGISTGTPNEVAKHVWSPNEITWRKMGDFYIHTAAQDVVDTDNLYIETLWLRNPHKYDLPIKIMTAS